MERRKLSMSFNREYTPITTNATTEWGEDKQTLRKATVKTSDGSSADYYKFPEEVKELQDLISYKNMNAQIAEIFRECYRYGEASHSPKIRGIKKILFYANAELQRLERYEK